MLYRHQVPQKEIAVFVWGSAITFSQPASTELLAQGTSVLILLAACALVFRTFRERYLLCWLCGWAAYLLYRVAGSAATLLWAPPTTEAISQGAFIVAVSFFVAAILHYTNGRRWLLPMALVAAFTLDLAVLRALWWQDEPVVWVLVHVLYIGMTLAAAVRLALFSRGRRQTGPWLMSATLVLLHLDASAADAHIALGVDFVVEVLLGISMLLIVLDDSKARARRLEVANVVTTAIAQAQSAPAMMHRVLAELKELHAARAGWIRLLQGHKLVMVDHIGLSEAFVSSSTCLDASGALPRQVMSGAEAAVVAAGDPGLDLRDQFRGEGFNHIVIVPVKGKNSVIGCLGLGFAAKRSYTEDELAFLATMAKQLGIAVENVTMFEQVVHSQRQWMSTFDSIKDLVLLHGSDFRIMKANRAMMQRLGLTQSEVIQQPCEQVLPRGHSTWTGCPYCESANTTGEGLDPAFGGYSLVSTSSYAEEGGSRVGTIHIITDTTEQHAAEEKYRLFFQQVQEGVFISTPDGRLLDCNDAFIRMLGYSSREEMLAVDITRDLYFEAQQRDAFRQAMAQDNFVRNFEVVLRRKDGTRLCALENSFASRDRDGNVERYQGFLLDITEQKRAEEDIQRHNRELHALNAIALIATQSSELEEIFGVTLRHVGELFGFELGAAYLFDAERESLLRRGTWGSAAQVDVVLPETREFHSCSTSPELLRLEAITSQQAQEFAAVARCVGSGALRSWITGVMTSGDRLVGMLVLGSFAEHAFSATDSDFMAAVARQVATTIDKIRLFEETTRAYEDLRRTQEQLLQSEKMSAVGQLISGVAHELNNPLTAILGYAQLLDAEQISERAHDFVQKLYKQAQRTHRVVQNLLSFARQRTPLKQAVDIGRVLEDALALRDYDLKLSNIAVIRDVQPALPTVIADAHQLEQVFLNIINNAADAILETARGGTLSVCAYGQDERVQVEFHDSGPGVSDLKRIFDPFYTTKTVGKGTGLGLSICYGIVKEHGGNIEAFNHQDGGAVFRITLPVVSAAASRQPRLAAESGELTLRGRILLVDDEEALLDFEREVLAGAGAEVETASSGAAARQRLERETFDVVIMDGKMPGEVSGADLYHWIVAHRPELRHRMMFTLSHATDAETRAFLESTQAVCLAKPFEVKDLVSTAARLLADGNEAAAQAT